MDRIFIKNDFGINDLGELEEVNNIIEKIEIGSNKIVELNLRHCFIDYPVTSKIIDKILYSLEKLNGTKELIIKNDYYLPEPTLLNLLLLGSDYFGLDVEKELSIEDLKKAIEGKIKPQNIYIDISVVDRKGEPKIEYKYGY